MLEAAEGLRSRTMQTPTGEPVRVTHHRLKRVGELPALVMLSGRASQSVRTHQEHPIKDRSTAVFPPQIRIESAGHEQPDSPSRYVFTLDRTTTVKVAGFNCLVPNTESTRHLYSTGTSQPNILVVTDNMTACIAIACAAENIHPHTGERLPGAKVRVFHLLPFVHEELIPDEVLKSVAQYVTETKQRGLTIRCAMHGGDPDGGISTETAIALRNLFEHQDIALEFDETCEKRLTDTPLGAVIRDDHSVQFVTRIVAVER